MPCDISTLPRYDITIFITDAGVMFTRFVNHITALVNHYRKVSIGLSTSKNYSDFWFEIAYSS